MLYRRIEEVSLNSWPALQQLLYDGWSVRFAKGFTKRANSVNPVYDSSLDVTEKVAACERLYHERGLTPVFRLTSFAPVVDLEQVLDHRHYQRIDQSSVQHLDLQCCAIPREQSLELRDEPLDDWMALHGRLDTYSEEQHADHKEILQAIPSRRLLASLVDAGRPVACGLGVLEQEFFGLFDLVTDPHLRNRGYGVTLVSEMLRWAQEHGARHAYLQVVSTNAPALHLYAKLGFHEIYRYWYRVLPS